jgi:inner membrane protein
MDTVTHGLAGYVVAKTGLTRDTGRWGVIAGVLASILPDIDSLLGPFVGTEFTIRYHRGLTNSLLLTVPFSLFFAWLFFKISGEKRYGTFFLICFLEVLVHNFLDLVTSYGTMILSPLSWERFALDWVFIIDLFLTGMLLFFTLAMWIWKSRSKMLARLSVVLATLYICLCAGNHAWALSLARRYAMEQGLKAKNISSLPQPLSPFHWANYIVTEDTIYKGLVNLIGEHERTASSKDGLFLQVWAQYQPIRELSYEPWHKFDESSWVESSLALDGVKTFLWFARFPVVRYEGLHNGKHCVTFFDLRFGGIEGRKPFLYQVIFDPKGGVVFQGFRRDQTSRIMCGID